MNMTDPLHLDVRPILEKGQDPFHAVMEARDTLEEGQALILTAPFEPLPLYDVFRNQGFTVEARQTEDGAWEVRFEPGAEATARVQVLDLREMDPPGPLQKALEALSMLGREETLAVHTRFRPVFLLEQLEERGFDGDSNEEGPHHWVTHIWRITS